MLVVDKPEGITSFDVVREVKRALKTKKAGHTGTLDPMATGVLPVCVGDATRIAGYLTEGDKTYEAGVRLGAATDTQDRTGKVIAEADPSGVTREALEAALEKFRGVIEQVPPMFSAIRVDGQRLYDIAREGGEVERAARKITIHSLELLGAELPDFTLRVRCSKGTYIRTLAHDLGAALGVHAHLTSLRRVETAGFGLERGVTLNALRSMKPEEIATKLTSEKEALSSWPEITVAGRAAQKVRTGMRLTTADVPALAALEEDRRLRLCAEDGAMLALAEWKGGATVYLRVLVDSSGSAK